MTTCSSGRLQIAEIPSWWLALRGYGADKANDPVLGAQYNTDPAATGALATDASGTAYGSQASSSNPAPMPVRKNAPPLKQLPKGFQFSTNPQTYAQQIQQYFGMTPSQLAQFMGLSGYNTAGQRAGAGANVLTTGSDPYQFGAEVTGTDWHNALIQASYNDASKTLRDAELGYQFGGLNQYLTNLNNQGEDMSTFMGGNRNPAVQNVSMQGLSDPASLSRLIGQLSQGLSRGNQAGLEEMLRTRDELIPDWAPEARDRLAALGIPYLPLEYLWSPELNLDDPNAPLFGNGEAPLSLFGAHMNQEGELDFLQGLTRDEIIDTVIPMLWATEHRAAGAPTPFEAGLTFGSPVLQPDGSYEYSPMQGWTGKPQKITPEAMRLAGFSGEDVANAEDPTELLRQLGGGLYQRWVGWNYPGQDQGQAPPPAPGTPFPSPESIKTAMTQIRMEMNKPGADKFALQQEMDRLQQMLWQYGWWQNPAYGPWGNLDEDDRARFEALGWS